MSQRIYFRLAANGSGMEIYEIVPEEDVGPELVRSKPPVGKLRVVNIYVDSDTGKLVVEYETEE